MASNEGTNKAAPRAFPGSGASTALSAPDGSKVVQPSAAPAGERNVGSMWTQVQKLTRQKEEKETENQRLKGELEASKNEERLKEQRIQEEAERAAKKAAELQASEQQRQELERAKRTLEEQVAAHERRLREEEEARLAKEAAEGPPPLAPEEVRKEVLRAFDAEAVRAVAEQAQKTGAAGSSEDGDEPLLDIDIEAMLEDGTSDAVIAEQYLSQVCEATVKAVEPARLQAVGKWKNELKKRRQLQDQLQELKGSIRVMCRVRPPDPGEEVSVSTSGDSEVAVTEAKGARKSYALDHVFGSGSTQEHVFEEVEPVLDSVLAGFNVCIFAYGQTGSGKTFTMEGKRSDDTLLGINPRALRRLFELIQEKQQLAAMSSSSSSGANGGGASAADDGWTYEVHVSYLEIYNEILRDLLVAPKEGDKSERGGKRGSKSLDVSSVKGQAVCVPGLTVEKVSSAAEVDTYIQRGASRRAVSATKCNSESSRSHSIVMVSVTGKNAHTGQTTHGKLNLVDLAGSERVKKSGVEGVGMAEAQNINKSLSALGTVMASLQEKSAHIPFRDSKLTQLLADSLGGNSKTFMFVNVNPSASAAPETKCSLEFAARVRRVELGKAGAKTSAAASLADLNRARAGEEQANANLQAANQRMVEVAKEAANAKEMQAQLEKELAAERAALAKERARLQKIEEAAKSSEGERAAQAQKALAEERKKTSSLEEQLRDALARLDRAEKQGLQAARAEGAAESQRPKSAAPASAGRTAAVSSQQRTPSEMESSVLEPPARALKIDAAPSPAPAAFPISPVAGKAPLPSPMALKLSGAAKPLPETPTLVPPTPAAAPSVGPRSAPVAPAGVSSVPLVPVTISNVGGGSSSVLGAASSMLSAAASKVSSAVLKSGGSTSGPMNLMDAPVMNLIDAPVVMTSTNASPAPSAAASSASKRPAGGGITRTELAPKKPAAASAAGRPATAPSATTTNLLDSSLDPALVMASPWISSADATADADALFERAEADCASPRVSAPSGATSSAAAAAPSSATKRLSPQSSRADAAPAEAPTSTPGKKAVPRYTPNKLMRPEGVECIKASIRKVKFAFDDEPEASSSAANMPAFGSLDESNGMVDEDGDGVGSFPCFTNPTEKENQPTPGSATSDGSAVASGFKKTLSSVVSAAASAGASAPSSGGSIRQFSLGGLGGGAARRVLVSDKSKRTLRDRQSVGPTVPGAIAKGSAVGRRMSLAAQQAIESAAGSRAPRNTAWQ